MRQFRYLHSDTEGMEKFETLYICKKESKFTWDWIKYIKPSGEQNNVFRLNRKKVIELVNQIKCQHCPSVSRYFDTGITWNKVAYLFRPSIYYLRTNLTPSHNEFRTCINLLQSNFNRSYHKSAATVLHLDFYLHYFI